MIEDDKGIIEPMLQLTSSHRLDTIEAALHQAAHRRGAGILFVNHLGNMLADRGFRTQDVVLFSVSLPDLYAKLLGAEINFASFLPCRIAAFATKDGLTLSAVSPREFCPIVGRPDLDWLAAELETALTGIMEEAARLPMPAARAATALRSSPGATELQVNLNATVPQRIDARGTKVEDIAGTGVHDSQGG